MSFFSFPRVNNLIVLTGFGVAIKASAEIIERCLPLATEKARILTSHTLAAGCVYVGTRLWASRNFQVSNPTLIGLTIVSLMIRCLWLNKAKCFSPKEGTSSAVNENSNSTRTLAQRGELLPEEPLAPSGVEAALPPPTKLVDIQAAVFSGRRNRLSLPPDQAKVLSEQVSFLTSGAPALVTPPAPLPPISHVVEALVLPLTPPPAAAVQTVAKETLTPPRSQGGHRRSLSMDRPRTWHTEAAIVGGSIEWINSICVQAKMPRLGNFTSDWKDGRRLALLLNYYNPGSVAYDPSNKPYENLKIAFHAVLKLGIKQMDFEDVGVNPHKMALWLDAIMETFQKKG